MRGIPAFSPQQRRLFRWWREGYDAVICDGAVRSGKTFAMGIAFFLWAMSCHRDRQFALCAATLNAVRRNLLAPVLPVLRALGFQADLRIAPPRGWEDATPDLCLVLSNLLENGLEPKETIVPISARLIANKVSYKFKYQPITALCGQIQARCR